MLQPSPSERSPALKPNPKPITVKAVVEYATQLRREADLEIAGDPYACPYRPTEAGARKMSARYGPQAAIENMRSHAAMHKRAEREHAQVAAASLTKHKARHRNFHDQVDRRRRHLRLGQRIDDAIGRLSLVASSSAATIGQSVHGGTPNHSPAFSVDAADKARRIALKAVREIEALEDEARTRDLSKAAA